MSPHDRSRLGSWSNRGLACQFLSQLEQAAIDGGGIRGGESEYEAGSRLRPQVIATERMDLYMPGEEPESDYLEPLRAALCGSCITG